MIERGSVHAVWMTALRRLIELLRIAKEDDGFRRLGNGQDVGQGHLGRLVDEEHVDRIDGVRTSPKPSGPACDPAIVDQELKGMSHCQS